MKYRKEDMRWMWFRLVACFLILSVLLYVVGAKAITAAQKGISVWQENRAVELARKESLAAEKSIAEAEARSTEAAEKESHETEADASEEASTVESMDPEAVYQDYLKNDDLTYFINNCDSKDFEYSDISGFDQTVCRLALNGIYARSGREFKDEALTAFYNDFSWYHPTISPDSFTNSMFNDHQSNNRDMLLKYMKEKGYR